ncbi:StbA family protein [Scytonema sp. UIC 10036]|uniref:ParM/StbA family protein n=1 Tax=Scytonema sp. UIC 10036 TaxID=2304196 RepID=UPI0012DAC17A|nr:ParM/StbA family protein [Scytonema sp. UIC 10036]MUH00637.1 StbA family protein [Scytonema sp. UIC 10036]
MTNVFLKPSHGYDYSPAHAHLYPQIGQVRTRIVFDGGNRFVKWVDPHNQVQCIPSCVKEVTEYQWRRLKPDHQTVLVELEGKRYVIGKLAQELGGEPTFQKDKCELAEILVLAVIEPNPGFDHVRIEQLAIALPNTLNDEDVAAVSRIANHPLTKEFTRNGQAITYTVGEVVPIDETYPAFVYAQQQGFYQFPDAKNAVWDIGGGTAIARLYTANGSMIQTAEVILPGTKHLAQQIAAELKEVFNLDYSPSLVDIMDAIQRHDYLYGIDKLDFWAIYDRCASQWVESARAEIRSKWVDHLAQLGHVLVVGGSASLAQPICEATGDRFFIPDNPQLFNIIAMAHME